METERNLVSSQVLDADDGVSGNWCVFKYIETNIAFFRKKFLTKASLFCCNELNTQDNEQIPLQSQKQVARSLAESGYPLAAYLPHLSPHHFLPKVRKWAF